MPQSPSKGKIVRIEADGLTVFQDVDTAKVGYFTLNKVKGFRGQSAKKLNLREGELVTYWAKETADEVVQVDMVEASA